MLVPFVRQQFQKGDQRVDLGIGQRLRRLQHLAVDRRVHVRRVPGLAGLGVGRVVALCRHVVVERQYRPQLLEDTVAHVRPRYRDIAQRRDLHLAVVGAVVDVRAGAEAEVLGLLGEPFGRQGLVVPRRADVLVLVVREGLVRAFGLGVERMAGGAVRVRLGEKERIPKVLLVGHRVLALQKAVVLRIERREGLRLLERRDAFGHGIVAGVDVVEDRLAVERLERRHVGRVLHDPFDDARAVGHHHLRRIEERPLRLRFEVRRPAVVELTADVSAVTVLPERRGEHRVGRRRGVASPQRRAVVAHRERPADGVAARIGHVARVDKAVIGVVAGRAGHRLVEREVRIKKKRFAQRRLRHRFLTKLLKIYLRSLESRLVRLGLRHYQYSPNLFPKSDVF